MVQRKPIKLPSQLPNAPLVEVVFEFRWALGGSVSMPEALKKDPGYAVLADAFADNAKKFGFTFIKKMADETFGHAIDLRLYKGQEQSFPLWQIGPGIFACNESAAYEWGKFKKLALEGLKLALSDYPKMKSFSLKPVHIELRYIDSFDSSLLSYTDLTRFISEHTSLKIGLPAFLTRKPLSGPISGSLVFSSPVDSMKDTVFNVRLANARTTDKETIMLESKILTRSTALNIGATVQNRVQNISNWLDKAHSLTSPFFKEFINESLMDSFRQTHDA